MLNFGENCSLVSSLWSFASHSFPNLHITQANRENDIKHQHCIMLGLEVTPMGEEEVLSPTGVVHTQPGKCTPLIVPMFL